MPSDSSNEWSVNHLKPLRLQWSKNTERYFSWNKELPSGLRFLYVHMLAGKMGEKNLLHKVVLKPNLNLKGLNWFTKHLVVYSVTWIDVDTVKSSKLEKLVTREYSTTFTQIH